ncbi:hypothetical protein GOBAR_AA09555 [Gossypium barbadense]|uniref:Uncharacterized protein n=1 Tax=Gossypium barbadense TaxID=3634 RepID=A0A2P5Y6C3_GOSBA|nr:hypothetical protein GOBAR_AA09555 [Gossypium barbadense]
MTPVSDPVAFSSTASGSRKKFTGTCNFCKLKSHKKESYYRLIGFPPDFKFNRKKAPPSALAVSSYDSSLTPQNAPTFTPQQYSQILELLNKSQVPVAPTVNCAGIPSMSCSVERNFFLDFRHRCN